MDIILEGIMKKYCDDFNQAICDENIKSSIVTNSIPIIWFGNMDSYLSSPKKIVTVGLNPSCYEFLYSDMFPLTQPRFQNIDLNPLTQTKIGELYNTLNAYFDGKNANPYMRYFNQYEELLHSLNASYFRQCNANTAIHIDTYSAMATFSLWGKVDKSIQNTLKKRGSILYSEFVNYLNPDIILFSANKKSFLDLYSNWVLSDRNEFDTGAYINAYRNTFNCTKPQLLLHGRNFHGTPFGGLSRDKAKAIIKKIVEQNNK